MAPITKYAHSLAADGAFDRPTEVKAETHTQLIPAREEKQKRHQTQVAVRLRLRLGLGLGLGFGLYLD